MNNLQLDTMDAIPELAGPDEQDSTMDSGALVPKVNQLSTNMDLAVRMYAATGKNMVQVAKASNVSAEGLRQALKSQAGRNVLEEIRGALDTQFRSLYQKVIDTVEEGLDHTETQVALASAALWLKHEKTTKVEVVLSAEDVIQKLMAGEDLTTNV